MPTQWGSQGRLNLIGTLAIDAQGEHLEVRELTASCTQDAVIAYLDTLAAQSDTYSVQFPYIRDSAGYTSISRNTYFFLLPPVKFNPQTARDSIGIRMRQSNAGWGKRG